MKLPRVGSNRLQRSERLRSDSCANRPGWQPPPASNLHRGRGVGKRVRNNRLQRDEALRRAEEHDA